MNAPTLLVGLGGAGCKIVARVAPLVTPEQRKSISMIVFDTDINELGNIRDSSPFIRIIQTSTKQTVGEYLDKDTHARDTWFQVNAILNSKTLTEGAGQVRAISRLALETVIRAGKMEPLHEAIQDLYKVEEEKPEQALRVIIVSSLAGGTGSGLILPVAMYIKHYLAAHYRHSANITRGFFLLPEVFYGVIPGATERNNLKANAYATLRELDAFLMKGDDTLPARYRDSVKIQFPRVASEGYEEYNDRPYDFCFLFDAQNADGGKLDSHNQYLDHAANCIYAQSIGPMNKRSNSSEDNTIRRLAEERGRNRYAGAGASMLVYPTEDVKTYVALQWAKETISRQWLVYDAEYRALVEDNRKREEEGVVMPEIDPNTHYIKAVEEKASKKDPFSMAICRACASYNADGVTKLADRWVEYIAALKEKIEKDTDPGSEDLKEMEEAIPRDAGSLGADWNDYISLYKAIESYHLRVQKFVEETSRISAYSMFWGTREFRTTKPERFELEYYLSDPVGRFLHPNAVRYFLNKALELMTQEVMAEDTQLKNLTDEFTQYEDKIFDNTDTKNVKETADFYTDKKASLVYRLTSRPSGDQEEIRDSLLGHYTQVKEYKKAYMVAEVLREGCEYIRALLKTFEEFYRSFETKVNTIERSLQDIRRRYTRVSGSTMRYVCADEACLKGLFDGMRYTGSTIVIDSELAKKIYGKVLSYTMTKEKPTASRYFSELFDQDILGYYKNSAMNSYKEIINMDILQALEKEAQFLHPEYTKADNASELIEQYVRRIITNTRALACPFIESPMGEPREPINACAYNSDMVKDAKREDPPKYHLIEKLLMDFGGVDDDDVPRNMIMFYQSFYGLRANNLSKFAPPVTSPTYTRASGEYFKAYYELIAGIHPEAHRSREISPHIDRWWHIVTKMPDLDEENQRRQEQRIYGAFFWAVMCKYVKLEEASAGRQVYRLSRVELGMEDSTMIVSNGTECDRLYEVLDAIAIYPELAEKITARVQLKTEDDVSRDRPLDKGLLMRCLSKFSLAEPGLGKDGRTPARSVFTLPMLMKKSANPEDYREEDMLQILRAEIGEIRAYLSRFCNEKTLPDVMGSLLQAQFDQFLKDMEVESAAHPSLYRESLFGECCILLSMAFEDLGLEDTAQEIMDRLDDLRA